MVGKRRYGFFLVTLVLGMLLGGAAIKQEAHAASLRNNPYITFSPDEKAFTTNAGDTAGTWYSYGKKAETGAKGSLPQLLEGQHYYRYARQGVIPVSDWQVRHVAGQCIHNSYNGKDHYHGVPYRKNNCMRRHYSGWLPICADCGDTVTNALFYMSEGAAKSIGELDMSMSYYYLCPYCDNLEQGFELYSHNCLAVSANRYFVKYNANGGSGYMADSVHMYDNASIYEGEEVKPQQTLTKNSYTRWGYEFVGWTTEADGSGTFYTDGEVIKNLTAVEGEVVTLYAKWRRSVSTLFLDTNGGSYEGASGMLSYPGDYGTELTLSEGKAKPPKGPLVSFNAQGGSPVEEIRARQKVSSFMIKEPMQGKFCDNVYTYMGADGSEDYAKILYAVEPVTLPETQREGYSFGGWYYDKACTKPAGIAGSSFTPTKDVTLYAGWTLLHLEAKDNYMVNDGAGGVDLSWEMDAAEGKTYKVYQKKEDGEFLPVGEGFAVGEEILVEESFSVESSGEVYEIPYTGYYNLSLTGAQGEDYESHSGGKGGKITALLYLERGSKITYFLGTTQGESGGGEGSAFGNGGGYSVVFLDGHEAPIMVAGGGGGASSQEDGMPGGLIVSTTDVMEGGSGVCGGGGGYLGGSAGILEQHFHISECKHTHEGNPNAYGGCYTVRTTCGNRSFTQYERSSSFYYGNIRWDSSQGKYVSCFCGRCGSYSCPGHRDVHYGYRCNKCGTSYNSHPGACSAMKGYTTGCGRDESYVCGFEDGQILRSVPAYGGSCYGDMDVCLSAEMIEGVQEGDGQLSISSIRLGFHHEKTLPGVLAPDEQAPEIIDASEVLLLPEEENSVLVRFERPKDRGTAYYHKVEAYDRKTEGFVCESNHTLNTLTSGVIGYYYAVDEVADRVIVGTEEFYECSGMFPQISARVTSLQQYLHIAAVDNAGNIADTLHIKISDAEEILWPIYTEQIEVKEAPGVYADEEKRYYVKADGQTRARLSFQGYMAGIPRENYQITDSTLVTAWDGGNGSVHTKTPRLVPIKAGVHTYEGAQLQTSYQGETPLKEGGYILTKRFDGARSLLLTRDVVLGRETHGKEIFVYPKVVANSKKGNVSSEDAADRDNGVTLLPDGEGPQITGMEAFEGLELLDKELQKEISVNLSATDTDSGLESFMIQIINGDGGGSATHYDDDGDGRIAFTMELAEQIYNGDFAVISRAVDKVGNISTETVGMTGYYLSAEIERILPGEKNVFQAGESGILTIISGGYVDKLVITFPEEMAKRDKTLDREIVYEIPMYETMEEIEFMVPLYVPDGTYAVKVEAYKEGTDLENYPVWAELTVKGSVLDDFRTRLR